MQIVPCSNLNLNVKLNNGCFQFKNFLTVMYSITFSVPFPIVMAGIIYN